MWTWIGSLDLLNHVDSPPGRLGKDLQTEGEAVLAGNCCTGLVAAAVDVVVAVTAPGIWQL